MKKDSQNKKYLFHTLNGKFNFSIFLLALAVLTASCTIGYYVYRTNIEKIYNANIYSVAYQARSMTDGDALRQYAAQEYESEGCLRLKARLEELRKNMNAISIFIAQVDKPVQGSYFYIIDTFIDHDMENPLGASAPYPQAFQEKLESVYYHGYDSSGELTSMDSAVYGFNFFALVPVYDSSNEIAALLCVQSSAQQIHDTLQQYLVYAVGLSSVLVILFLLVNMAYMNRRVITPIRMITSHASRFISSIGMSDTLEKIHTGDEIETLADALSQMENDIRQYMENLAAASAAGQQTAAEYKAARQIQENLFPCHYPAFPGRKDFDICARMESCEAIGGNFYNFLLSDSHTLCLFAGEVSGNGIPTAMFSAITASFIRSYASLKLPPDRILADVNNQLSKNNHAGLTVNVFLAIIDLATGLLTYTSAGNNIRILLKKPGNAFEPLACKSCFPLASIEQAAYPMQQVTLAQGDILFLHTDGVSNARNPKGLSFGADYAAETISGLIQKEFSLKTMTDQFFAQLLDFEDSTAQSQDSTILLFRYQNHP